MIIEMINRKIGLAKPIFRSTSTLSRNGAKPQRKAHPFLMLNMNPCQPKKSRKLCVTATMIPLLTSLKKNLVSLPLFLVKSTINIRLPSSLLSPNLVFSLVTGSNLEGNGRATTMLPTSSTFRLELFDPVFTK